MLSKLFNKKRRMLSSRIAYGTPVVHSFRKRTSSPSKIKATFKTTIITVAILLTAYGIFFSNYFKIKEIIIADENFENQIIGEQIKENLKSALNKNIFFTKTGELEFSVLKKIPELEKVTISKNYPSTIEIEFLKYPLVANIINESSNLKKNYIVNSIGYATKEDFENPSLPYIHIKSDEPINTKKTVIEQKKLQYILDAAKNFEDKFGMKIKEIIYKPIPKEVHLFTEKNFYIWLDMQIPSENQFRKLKKALAKLDIYKENLNYIDLRIAGGNGDKIIYKRR